MKDNTNKKKKNYILYRSQRVKRKMIKKMHKKEIAIFFSSQERDLKLCVYRSSRQVEHAVSSLKQREKLSSAEITKEAAL